LQALGERERGRGGWRGRSAVASATTTTAAAGGKGTGAGEQDGETESRTVSDRGGHGLLLLWSCASRLRPRARRVYPSIPSSPCRKTPRASRLPPPPSRRPRALTSRAWPGSSAPTSP